MLKKISTNQHGSTMVLMTFFVMTSILIISLSLSAIAVNGLKLGTDQVQSTKAFFAAEAGAERILWEFRKNGNDPVVDTFNSDIFPCTDETYICYSAEMDGVLDSCDSCAYEEQKLSNETFYSIKYSYAEPPITKIISYGKFLDINRAIELKY